VQVAAAQAAEPERAGSAAGLDVGWFGAGAERDGDLTDRQPLMLAVSRARAWRQTRLPLRSNWKAASASTAARVRLAVIE
jgi:hypothetical protein